MEHHLVTTLDLGTQFSNHFTIDSYYTCSDEFISLTARTYTSIGQILVQTYWLLWIHELLLIFNLFLTTIFRIWFVTRTALLELTLAATTLMVVTLETGAERTFTKNTLRTVSIRTLTTFTVEARTIRTIALRTLWALPFLTTIIGTIRTIIRTSGAIAIVAAIVRALWAVAGISALRTSIIFSTFETRTIRTTAAVAYASACFTCIRIKSWTRCASRTITTVTSLWAETRSVAIIFSVKLITITAGVCILIVTPNFIF